MSWDQVLKYATLRKRYISLYASLLKADPGRDVIDDDKDIEELDRELDIELIVQWRYNFLSEVLVIDLLACHYFSFSQVDQHVESRKGLLFHYIKSNPFTSSLVVCVGCLHTSFMRSRSLILP